MSENSGLHLSVLLRVPEAAHMLGVGRSLTYELIAAGDLEIVHVGSVIRVPVDAVYAYVERRRLSESAVGSVR